ncbi:MAG: hypothetical protein ACI8V2_003542 [Candidatus Latescibacterota bacterium]|jgi:hypothetical protein
MNRLRSLFFTCLGFIFASSLQAEEPRAGLPGGIYDKPFIKEMGKKIAVGGYIDMEFEWAEGKNSTFDQHRFIPFIYSQVSDRVRVSTEIEFEHGGDVPGNGEVKLEYAVMDFKFSEAFNFRGGVILSPLGRFNLLHDSPLNDLTERPIVNTQILPSTLSESGMGFFGTFYPSEQAVGTYELYLVNGFDEGVITGSGLRIRSGRGSKKQDNNNDKALVGRLGISPRLGLDLGASLHTGKYDATGSNRLSILGLDAKLNRSIVELQGEYAFATANGVSGDQQGAYAQANIHFAQDHFLPGSVFTGVARWDWVDFDNNQTGDSEYGLTTGLNFRPVEDAVFKLDYNWTWKTPPNSTKGDAAGRFFFTISSYF